jgi:hypothetical protein
VRRVTLHIENLVLRGFRFEDRHLIAAALQEELARLLSEPQAVEQLAVMGDRPHVRAGAVRLGGNSKALHVGTETARAIGRTLVRPTVTPPINYSDGYQPMKESRSE